MGMEVTVVNASGDGVAPAVLVQDSRCGGQYLINAPEGFSRLVLEHRIRPSAKLSCLLLTSLHPFAAGGCGGLILRLAQDGHGQLHVIGPRGSVAYLHALRHIFNWRHPKVIVSDCTEQSSHVFEDDHVIIAPIIPVEHSYECPCCVIGDKINVTRQLTSNREEPYKQDFPDVEEGLNPVYIQDTNNKLQSYVGQTDEKSLPSVILGYTFFMKKLNARLIILDIPQSFSMDKLELFNCEQHPIAAVIHLSSSVESKEYTSWINKHQYFHCLVNSRRGYGFEGSLKTIAKLNLLDRKLFPLPYYNESFDQGGFISRLIIESKVDVRVENLDSLNIKQYQEDILKNSKLKIKQVLHLMKRRPVKTSPNQLAAAKLRQKLEQKPRAYSTTHSSEHSEENSSDFELLFLGTGCAEPSKYRGSSGILFRNSRSTILLDAGEGAYGQIVRRYGREFACETVETLECVWISHKYADHVLGLLSIICSRNVPLLVIGSSAVRSWLIEVGNAHVFSGRALPAYEFMHFEEVNAMQKGSKHSVKLRNMLENLQLRSIINVPVHHCYEAYGLVLFGHSGWSVVYSGDTRPSENLIRAGHGCTLLIHEATFEDCLEGHALRKRHSTITQALQVGKRMCAQQIVLTHFSQRYPKIVEMDTLAYPNSCMAFDGMVITSSNISCLKNLHAAMSLILAEPEEKQCTISNGQTCPSQIVNDSDSYIQGPGQKRGRSNGQNCTSQILNGSNLFLEGVGQKRERSDTQNCAGKHFKGSEGNEMYNLAAKHIRWLDSDDEES